MTSQDPANSRGFAVGALGEIAIRCRDIAAMTAFYRDIIGLELLARRRDQKGRNRIVFFKIADGFAGHTSVLALFDGSHDIEGAAPDANASTLHHLALTVRKQDQTAITAWLDKNDVAWKIENFAWIGWRGIFVKDPEGNTVELVAAV